MSEHPLPPRFAGNINFNAQHAPTGAFMSFTCGHFGSGGGIGVEIGRPADQNLIVGVKAGDRTSTSPIVCLPFLRSTGSSGAGAADFLVEQAKDSTSLATAIRACAAEDVDRHYGWGTDAWKTPDFAFAVHAPFGPVPDPDTSTAEGVRTALLPAVVATLRIDNREGKETKTAVFAIDFRAPGARVIGDGGAVGFAWRRSMGVLATVEDEGEGRSRSAPFAFQRWSAPEGVADLNPVHALGRCAGVALEVPPGTVRTLVLAIGVYLEGIVTTGLEGAYLYTEYYGGLQDVLATALARATELRGTATRLDKRLATSGLSPDQQFLVAHATRSYYGSTQLLDVAGEPFWIVNEGEYCMMNTLDLSVDQVFWELDQNPWVVRNLLDNFVRRYGYVDELQGPDGRIVAGGLSFAHDMGVNNNFSPSGHSSYELAHLTGCFSYMTAEQLCNWVLTATCYFAKTRDEAWLRRNVGTVRGCLYSLIARCGDSGLVHFDSARCNGGQEITTYDSLDPSLAQTRNNVYMAVKGWASYVGLALLADALGDEASSSLAVDRAERAARTVVEHAGPDGVIPAVFEVDNPGFASRILPACEGLAYPLYWEDIGFRPKRLTRLLESPETSSLVDALRRHVRAILNDPQRRNVFQDGGIRLSSTSGNSWMSKIALFQYVARGWFDIDADPAMARLFADADAAHVAWQTDGSGYWACSDQFVHGKAEGSKYYPRIITAALWLDQPVRGHGPAVQSTRRQCETTGGR